MALKNLWVGEFALTRSFDERNLTHRHWHLLSSNYFWLVMWLFIWSAAFGRLLKQVYITVSSQSLPIFSIFLDENDWTFRAGTSEFTGAGRSQCRHQQGMCKPPVWARTATLNSPEQNLWKKSFLLWFWHMLLEWFNGKCPFREFMITNSGIG